MKTKISTTRTNKSFLSLPICFILKEKIHIFSTRLWVHRFLIPWTPIKRLPSKLLWSILLRPTSKRPFTMATSFVILSNDCVSGFYNGRRDYRWGAKLERNGFSFHWIHLWKMHSKWISAKNNLIRMKKGFMWYQHFHLKSIQLYMSCNNYTHFSNLKLFEIT